MFPDFDAFIAEIDECAPGLPSASARRERWGEDMDKELENDRIQREQNVRRILSQRDPERVKRGIEAYKRDLPQLLREHKDRHVVAYDGDTQLAVAATREQLMQELADKGIARTSDMLIKVVKSLEEYDNVEHFHTSHTR